MASEIRVNKIINRSGLSTVTFSDTGAIVSGIVTANSFSGNITGAVTGSGANLTSIPAGQLTGTLPAISGANLTSLPAQATIANNADNRVITGGSGVNLNGEANFTFDGTDVQVPDKILLNTAGSSIKSNQLRFQGGAAYIDNYSNGQDINFRTSTSSALDTTGPIIKSNGNIAFASGKGIDFSASGNAGGMTSEILDDYEEGSWTPSMSQGSVNFTGATYTKVGRLVTVSLYANSFSQTSSSSVIQFNGLPFTSHSNQRATGAMLLAYITTLDQSVAYIGGSLTNIRLYHYNSGGDYTSLNYSAIASSSSTNRIFISITYQAAS